VIIHQNTKAIEFMNNGLFGEAIDMLNGALQCVQMGIIESCNEGADQETSGMNILRIGDSPSIPHQSDFSRDGLFELFDKAIVMETTSNDHDLLLAGSTGSQAICALLFNLGLAYHLSNKLDKALKIYRIAAYLLESSSDLDEIDDLIILGTINNLGCIYANFFKTAEARRCLKTIRIVLENWLHDPLNLGDLPEVYFHFYLTAFVGQDGNLIVCAAAA